MSKPKRVGLVRAHRTAQQNPWFGCYCYHYNWKWLFYLLIYIFFKYCFRLRCCCFSLNTVYRFVNFLVYAVLKACSEFISFVYSENTFIAPPSSIYIYIYRRVLRLPLLVKFCSTANRNIAHTKQNAILHHNAINEKLDKNILGDIIRRKKPTHIMAKNVKLSFEVQPREESERRQFEFRAVRSTLSALL